MSKRIHVPMFDRKIDAPLLTKAMLNQLRAYVTDRDREGWYYGNKQQFEARHKAILEWLDAMKGPR